MPAMLKASHKQSAIRAAKEVVDKLKKAVSDNEITRIMFSARNADLKGEKR